MAPAGSVVPGATPGAFPPTAADFSPGVAYHQVADASDELSLERIPPLHIYECFVPALGVTTAIAANYVVDRTVAFGRTVGNAVVDVVETTAVNIYHGVNAVVDEAEQLGRQTIDLISRFTMRITLRAGQVLGVNGSPRAPATVATPTNAPAYAWLPIAVPADAVLLSFEFTVTGDGKDDSLVFGVNGTNLFSLETKFLTDGETGSSRLIDVTSYAGRTNEFFFGLLGGTSTNSSVQIQNLKFFTLTPPQLAITQTNATTAVSWPSTLTGFSLETSDSLSPPLWQPVTNAPSLYGGTMTVTNIPSARANFFRLRKL